MRYVRLLLFVAIFAITNLVSVFAITPPFPGGPITSPYGPRSSSGVESTYHQGIDVGIDNTNIVAPADGEVLHGAGDGYDYYTVFKFGKNTPFPNQVLFFGDLNSSILSMNGGANTWIPVKEGDIIGLVSGYNPDVSTGAHAHIEYQPWGYTLGTGSPDVAAFLQGLGVDLSGNTVSGGADREVPGIAWNIEAMMTMGNSINETIKEWTGYATKALKNLHTVAIDLLISLAIIDFAMMISLSGFHVTPFDVIPKLLKYSFFIMLINYWDKFLNWFFRGFVEASSNIYGGAGTTFSTDVSQPQLLLQKAVHLIEPALYKLSSFGARDFISNLGSALSIYILCAVVTAIFIVVALYIMVCYIEFYISAGLNIMTLPFGVLHWTKFVSEGSLGHLLSSCLKLVIITCLVGLSTIAIKDASVADMFSATVNKQAESAGMPTDPTGNGYVAMIYEEAAKFGVDGDMILAIAMRESGGDTIDGIHMTMNYQGSGAAGIMQVMPGQDGVDEFGNTVSIDATYPGYQTDPRQNIRAGIAIYKSKLALANGDPVLAAGKYFGNTEAPYSSIVYKNYMNVKTHNYGALYGGNNPHAITTEQLSKFLVFCLVLIGFAFLILKLPNRIMKPLQGSVELP